jgi:hypothetical protein
MRQHLAKRRARAIDLTQSKISGRRTGEYVADEHADKTAASEQRSIVRRALAASSGAELPILATANDIQVSA